MENFESAKQPLLSSDAIASKGQGIDNPKKSGAGSEGNLKKAVFYQVISSFALSATQILIKISNTSNEINNDQIMLFRAVLSLSLAFAVIKSNNLVVSDVFEHKYPLLIRGISGCVTWYSNAYALQYLDLSTASIISNLAPFVGLVFGYYFLGEKIIRLHIIALLFTFLGVFLVIEPCWLSSEAEVCRNDDEEGKSNWSWALIFPFIAAFSRTLNRVVVRKAKSVHWIYPIVVVAIPVIFLSSGSLWLNASWVPLTLETGIYVTMAGVGGILTNVFMVKATQNAEISVGMAISYSGVGFMFLGDYFIFHDEITLSQIFGALTIFVGIVCLVIIKVYKMAK